MKEQQTWIDIERRVDRKKRNKILDTKNKYWRGRQAIVVIALDLAKKTGYFSTMGANRIYTYGGSRENEYSYCTPITIAGRIYSLYAMKIDCRRNCYNCRGFQTYYITLQRIRKLEKNKIWKNIGVQRQFEYQK